MSTETFELAVCDYIDMLYAVALKLTQDPPYAERLTRSTLLKAAKAYDQLDQANLKTWLLSLLRANYKDDMRWISQSQYHIRSNQPSHAQV